MAVTGFWPVFKNLKATLDYADNPDKTTAPEYLDEDLYAALRYAENDDKTDRKMFVGGINCSAQNAYAEMIAVQRRFGLRGKVVGYHGIQSFREGEVTPEQAFVIGKKTARKMWGDRYQVLVTVHLNTDNVHCHFVVNPVSFKDGAKFKNKIGDHKELRRISDEICREHELSVLENSEFYSKGKKKEYWVHKAGKKIHRDYLREDVEYCLSFATSPREFESQLYVRLYARSCALFGQSEALGACCAAERHRLFQRSCQRTATAERRKSVSAIHLGIPTTVQAEEIPTGGRAAKAGGSPLNTAMTLQPFWWMRCFILS